jgi:thiamine-monophosphate kinase
MRMMMDAVHENRLLGAWARHLPRPAAQIGCIHESDAELLPMGHGQVLALTVDTVADEITAGLYRWPETAVRIAVVASLSDLAAVGAAPSGLLLSVVLPAGDPEEAQAAVARGVALACERGGVGVLGGDTSIGPSLSVTCVAAGLVPAGEALLRVGAQAGDTLWASGPLGSGSALAAAALLAAGGMDEDDWQPSARLLEGQGLRGIARACMDTSDGLIATLDQLGRLNDLHVCVETPVEDLLDTRALSLARTTGLPPLVMLAGPHGEYELVFAVPPGRVAAMRRMAAGRGWRPLWLGHVEAGSGLTFGSRDVDGALVRNLAAQAGQDPLRAAHELSALLA